ncbi:cell division control protein 48 C-like, partial [Trifolium medium]|nr:cell division control protein 48 C-like [Trifolium medium]
MVKETLLRDVKLCKSTFSISNAIDIVDHLRSTYSSDYNRYNYMRLLYSVQNALDSLKNDNKTGEVKKEIKSAVTDHISETNAVRWKEHALPGYTPRGFWTVEQTGRLPQQINRFPREGFSPIPDVKWEDVGALDHVREEFDQHIVKRIKDPDVYQGPELLKNDAGESESGVRKLFDRA